MTARHAAAVARYARALAREVGCDESEQDVAHTAGLLHDIGKFALPDRILKADVLSDEDWALIRRHPQDGRDARRDASTATARSRTRSSTTTSTSTAAATRRA